MGDKQSRQRFPEEDSSSSSSSSSSASGTARGQPRYKPLAPKGPPSDSGHALQRCRSGARDAAQELQDLTFVNMTDPQQSKSRESRHFVRRQVMVNFAREKRRQQKYPFQGSTQASSNNSKTISGVQELLNVAMPTAEPRTDWSPEGGAPGLDSPRRHDLSDPLADVAKAPAAQARHGLQRRKPGPQPSAAGLLPSIASRAGNLSNVKLPHWPVAPDAHVQGLMNHCHSFLFRACYPQYMISLIANRPSADNYPLLVDIDSVDDLNQDYGAESVVQSEFYRLAEGSPMVAHVLLMVSASHLAILDTENAAARTRQAIDHKSKALALLNEAIKGLPADNYLEALAAIAVLASHELMVGHCNEWMVHLMGLGRIMDMKGGLTALPQEHVVRKLMIWVDQMGALVMNMRPFFPATEVMRLFFRPRTTITPSLLDEYPQDDFLSPAFRDFAKAFSVSTQLTEIFEDIATIRIVGTQNILNASPLPSLSGLVDMRDVLLHRILSLAPIGNESDDESSAEECVRLAALIFVLDRLFLPALPPAYHRILHVITDRLNSAVEGKATRPEWAGRGWVLMWIVFVGATVHNADPATSRSLVESVAPLCAHLFSGPRYMCAQLRTGLTSVMGKPELLGEELIDGFAAGLEQAYKV